MGCGGVDLTYQDIYAVLKCPAKTSASSETLTDQSAHCALRTITALTPLFIITKVKEYATVSIEGNQTTINVIEYMQIGQR